MKQYKKPIIRIIDIESQELLVNSPWSEDTPFHRVDPGTDFTDTDQEIGSGNPFDGGW